MAFTSLSQVLNAFPGQTIHFCKTSGTGTNSYIVSLWYGMGGSPVAATIPPTGDGEVPTKNTTGAIYFNDPSGSNKLYLAKFLAYGSSIFSLILYDRLWHNSGFVFNTTDVQKLNNPPVLTRPDSLGTDVELWLEVYSASGTTAATITATYVNQNGDTARQATLNKTTTAMSQNNFVPFQLQSGDTGVRSVSQVQLSAADTTAGNFGLVLLRRIAEIRISNPSSFMIGEYKDPIHLGIPEIHPNACLALMAVNSSTSATGIIGGVLNIIEG